jgi:hypothetical protein
VARLDASFRRSSFPNEVPPTRTRTDNPLIESQPSDSHNLNSIKSLRKVGMPVGHLLATDNCHMDPDLLAILEAWPTLPEAIKAGVVAMVKAARK